MKKFQSLLWMGIPALFLTGAALFHGPAYPALLADAQTTAAPPVAATPPATDAPPMNPAAPAPAALPEKSYTGKVVSVDAKERELRVKKGALSQKTFAIGDNCANTLLYTMLKNNNGAATDLRPGEKITVSYRDTNGVRMADRIEQQPMRYAGWVKAINPDTHTLILHRWLRNKDLDIAADCITLLADGRAGALSDIHPGDRVLVTYETPGKRPMAWQIDVNKAPSPR